MADPVAFGEKFTKWSDAWKRDDATRTFVDLSKQLGIDNTLLSHWRAGRHAPDPRGTALASMCRIFGLTPEESRELYALCGVDLRPTFDSDDPTQAAV